MGLIKIVPEEVRRVSAQFKHASDTSQQMVTELSGTVRNMESDWAGMTKDQFSREFLQWENTMKNYVELLGNIAKQLDLIAGRFEEADQPTAAAGAVPTNGRRSGPQAI